MFRRGSTLPARLVLQLLFELPDDASFIASLKASAPVAPDVESPAASVLRSRRRWRGWGTDRALLADIRDVQFGGKHRFPRPWDQDRVSVAGRRVLDLDQLP